MVWSLSFVVKVFVKCRDAVFARIHAQLLKGCMWEWIMKNIK